MRVLIACEFSGVVRDAFIRAGHSAISCDLLPCESAGPDGHAVHIQGDLTGGAGGGVLGTIGRSLGDGWEPELIISHPPCTFLSSSGLHWNKRRPERAKETEKALAFALLLWRFPVKYACMENPVGRLTKTLRATGEYVQIVQPYQFGHDASKATCLILRKLPPLRPTKLIAPRIVNGKTRWSNQTDSGQNRLAPSEHRAMDRARTYTGIANAMAEQWGNIT